MFQSLHWAVAVAPPVKASENVQLSMHTPPEQEPLQTCPQPPQFSRSVRVLVSQPNGLLRFLHDFQPGWQAVGTQRLVTQANSVFPALAEHAWPQAPQFLASVPRSISQPLAGFASQFPLKAGQEPSGRGVGVGVLRRAEACAAVELLDGPVTLMSWQADNKDSTAVVARMR